MTLLSNMPKSPVALIQKTASAEVPSEALQKNRQMSFDEAKSLSLPTNFGPKLFAFANNLKTDYQVVLWSAFKLLIFRLTLENQIFIDFPRPNQKLKNVENWVKNTHNTIQLHIDISEQWQFTELLDKVDSTYREKLAAQKILPEEKQDNYSVFYYTFPSDVRESKPAKEITSTQEAASLKICFTNNDNAVQLTIAYNTQFYQAPYITELIQQYHFLLKQIIDAPNDNILKYSLVTDEVSKILPDPSQPLRKQWHKSIPDVISEQAQKSPRATAVVDDHGQWTYADLESLSNQIGNYLVQSGIRERDVVAVFASREGSLVASILGILKAGAAFMILDPGYPSRRLLKQLTLGEPKAFLHLEGAGELPSDLENFIKNNALHYLKLSSTTASLSGLLARLPSSHPAVQISANHLAYLAFTSGSTGEPKGILGSHLPLAHFFPWHINKFGLQSSDKFSMLSGLSHDPILRDMFTPLCLGTTLFIPNPVSLFDSDRLFNWLRDNKISVVHLTPSLSQLIATRAIAGNQTLPHLRYAFFGGERLEYKTVQNFLALAPKVTCVNFYGATETPQAMAYHIVKPPADLKKRRQIPLGQGIANVQLLVLNQEKQLAGVNELGEIYIRTPYLSDGYLGDHALTKEKFLENPFTNLPGDKLYKTGDLGRYGADGLIDFFNRKDQQVNIRGFRIELGEIKHTLGNFPSLFDCYIDVKETHESKYIVAFYRAAKPICQEELKAYLKSHLPYYMIPTFFLFVEEYPRTPNGKIDKQSLLALVDKQNLDRANFVPAKTRNETLIVEIWQKLLKINQIGIYDDFFDLGGHSISVIEMLIRVRNIFGVEISPNELFQKATIFHICHLIEAAKQKTADSSSHTFKSLVNVHSPPADGLPNLFCVHGGGGNILFLKEWEKHAKELNLPLFGFQARGIDGIAKPHSSIEEMAHDYIQEMREHQPTGPYFIAGYSGGGSIALEMATLLKNNGEEVPVVLLIDSYHPDVQHRRLTFGEHLRHALKHPLYFVFQKIGHYYERFQMPLRKRSLQEILENNQQIPLELRDLYVSTHLSELRQNHKIESYDGTVILFRATKVWPMYDHIDRDLGWGESLQNLKIVDVEGDHDDLIREPNVRNLLLHVSEVMTEING